MKAAAILAAVASLGSGSVLAADDFLYSNRLSRRGWLENGTYNLAFFHVNNVQGHLSQFTKSGQACTNATQGCYGGYARIKTKVDELRGQHADHLFVDAGGELGGTLFWKYYGGDKVAETLNDVGLDAMTLGTPEWDGGDEVLGRFVKKLNFPVLSSNVRTKQKELNETVKRYHVFEQYDVAVIGVTSQTTPDESRVDANETVFLDPVSEVQSAIYDIRNTTRIRRIVALSYLGYLGDQRLARQTEGLSLVIGGGNDYTFLGNGDGNGDGNGNGNGSDSKDVPEAKGNYPTIVTDTTGLEVFVVTAYRWGEYIGFIELNFGPDGRALSYHGGPIHLDNTTALDADLQANITAWKVPIDAYAAQVVGSTKNVLDQTACETGDCLAGQVLADAMLEHAVQKQSSSSSSASNSSSGGGGSSAKTPPAFALINSHAVHASIGQGTITRNDVINAFPNNEAVALVTYTGSDVRKVLEGCVSRVNQFTHNKTTSWFQVSHNLLIAYNAGREAGSRLVNVSLAGAPLDDAATYTLVTSDDVARGADALLQPLPSSSSSSSSSTSTGFVRLGDLDQVFASYVAGHTPLQDALQQRVVLTNATAGPDPNSTTTGAGGKAKPDDKSAAARLQMSMGLIGLGLAAVFV